MTVHRYLALECLSRNAKVNYLIYHAPGDDLSPQEAREYVMAGGSPFVSGLPGVAKSYTCVSWVEELKKERRVMMCAPTHVATRNLRCDDVESINSKTPQSVS